MSGFKRLNQQDVYVTSYTAKKSWSISGTGEYAANDVKQYSATSGSTYEYYVDSSDLTNNEYSPLVWRSLHQLYFSNYDRTTGGIETSGSFENYEESSLMTGSRYLLDSAAVISIPRDKFGTHIEPASITLDGDLLDDGEGYLRKTNRYTGEVVGQVIYSHGMLIISKASEIPTAGAALSWKSNQPIYTYHFNCKASDYEFNATLNRTAHKDANGNAKDFVTGSDFQPYVTAVGLYNDANELVAVGKLSKPLPKSRHVETVIKVRLDM